MTSEVVGLGHDKATKIIRPSVDTVDPVVPNEAHVKHPILKFVCSRAVAKDSFKGASRETEVAVEVQVFEPYWSRASFPIMSRNRVTTHRTKGKVALAL